MSKMNPDQLTATYTACDTFSELMGKVLAGYTPTLRKKEGNSKATSQYNYEITQLCCEILLAGGKVFDGNKTHKM